MSNDVLAVYIILIIIYLFFMLIGYAIKKYKLMNTCIGYSNLGKNKRVYENNLYTVVGNYFIKISIVGMLLCLINAVFNIIDIDMFAIFSTVFIFLTILLSQVIIKRFINKHSGK